MKFHYTCTNAKCKNSLSFGLFRLGNKIVCDKCGKEYVIFKHTKLYMLEMFILVTIVMSLKSVLDQMFNNLFFEIVFICICAIIFNFVYDLVLASILKEKYFIIEEKYQPKQK